MVVRAVTNVILTTAAVTATVIAGPAPVVVMPAGHSIARGFGSTNANGWRKGWYEGEVALGRSVNMVGDYASGTFADTDHEAVDGIECDAIDALLVQALPQYRPDLVLVMCGVVDAIHSLSASTIISRIDSLLDHAAAHRLRAWVVVATILPTTTPSVNTTTAVVNAALPGIVATHQLAGQRVMLADLSNVINASTETIDGLHPNDAGYAKIATRMLSETASVLGIIDAGG